MSLFDEERFRWRDTYFVVFPSRRRPTLEAVATALRRLGSQYLLHQLEADDEGRFESVTVIAPQEYAAMDVSYLEGDEVVDEIRAMTDEMQPADAEQRTKIEQARHADARFDVMHFEQVTESPEDESDDEMVDPSALLAVLEVLTHLTGGVGIDPQSGDVL